MDKYPGRSVLISDHGRERAEGREQRGGESREEERAERRREFRRRREQRGGGSREEEGVPEERTRAGDQRLVVRGEADRADVRVLYHRTASANERQKNYAISTVETQRKAEKGPGCSAPPSVGRASVNVPTGLLATAKDSSHGVSSVVSTLLHTSPLLSSSSHQDPPHRQSHG